ncbi:hypothetical protein Dimus_000218 [Dionaea muscipula]
MSADGGDQCSCGGSESEEVTGRELQRESRISYCREYLLSLEDLDVCKKLPSGVDKSILSELDECCQQISALSSGGVLGDFTKPIIRGNNAASNHDSASGRNCSPLSRHSWLNRRQDGILGSCSVVDVSEGKADAAASTSHQTNHLLSRSSQPYRPPSFYKAPNDSRRASCDSFNNDTFGSSGVPGPERLLEERRRKASFDSTRKWQKKVVQENGQSLLDDQKENFDPDICSLVHVDSKAESTSREYHTAGSDGLKGKEIHGGSCSQLYHTKEIDAINANKKEESTVPASDVEVIGDSSGVAGAACQVYKLLESCVDQGDKCVEFAPWKSSEDTSRRMSGQDRSAPMLQQFWDAASVSEIWNLPFSFKPYNINGDDTRASKSCTSKFAHLFADGDSSVFSGVSSGMLVEHNLQDFSTQNQTTSKLLLSTSAAPAENISKLCYGSRRSIATSRNPTNNEGQTESKSYKEAEQQSCSIDVNASNHLLTMLQRGARIKDLNMSQEMIGFPRQVYNANGTVPYMGQILSTSDSSERHLSQRSEQGRNLMKELQSREASVSTLNASRGNLKKAEASEIGMYHPIPTRINQGYHKPQLPHVRKAWSQPVKPSKLGTGVQVSERTKSSAEIQLPEEDSLITVDDTVIYQPPTPTLSNPKNKLMGQGNFDRRFNSQQPYPWYGQSEVHASDALQFKGMAYQNNPSSSPHLPATTFLPHPLQQTPAETRLMRQVPDSSADKVQHNGCLPTYLFNDPAADAAVYGCINHMPCDAQVPNLIQSSPFDCYHQNMNPNMDVAIPACASGGNLVGFNRLLEMETRLKQLMNHKARARYQRDLNLQTVYRF